MARLLKCEDIGIECDYICAETEEELTSAGQRNMPKQKKGGTRSRKNSGDRVLSLSRPIECC